MVLYTHTVKPPDPAGGPHPDPAGPLARQPRGRLRIGISPGRPHPSPRPGVPGVRRPAAGMGAFTPQETGGILMVGARLGAGGWVRASRPGRPDRGRGRPRIAPAMPDPSRSDMKLYERALRNGWDVPAATRVEVIRVLGEIVGDAKATTRERTSAARAVMQASRVELDAIRVAQGLQYEDLIRRVEALEGEAAMADWRRLRAGIERLERRRAGPAGRPGPVGLVRRGLPVRAAGRRVPGAPARAANQRPPAGDWRTWLLLMGRGAGKTRSAAEWVRHRVESGAARRIALVGATAADVRDMMVEGESGLLAICPPWFRPRYEPSKRRLTWPNGAGRRPSRPTSPTGCAARNTTAPGSTNWPRSATRRRWTTCSSASGWARTRGSA